MRLKNEMERELGISIPLRAGLPGSLRVVVDGKAIYSKKESGQPPNAAEIISLIRGKTPQQN